MDKRRIYVLRGYPPEVVAVAFAKCSRSPENFDEIAKELNEDKSRQFHEKWVVGYGHSSVAEHAVLNIAIENVSILATKVIEDNRLASYTEKSTRYQVFTKDRVYKPKKIMDSKHKKVYEETIELIFEVYDKLYPRLVEFLKEKHPKKSDEPEKVYGIMIKNMALDCARSLLPVATLTNLGMTINARALEYAIVKMWTHPLDEIKEIGEDIKKAGLEATPTLIKYAKYNEYLGKTTEEMEGFVNENIKFDDIKKADNVTLVEYDKDAENKLVAALLYRFSKCPYEQIKEKVKKMPEEEKEKIIDMALKRLEKFDRPLRELEHVDYTFDILMDYGSFRDVQRHRIVTQTNQEFNADHSYIIPEEVIEAGFKEEFEKVMKKAKEAYSQIKEDFPKEAQYIIPMAFKKRLLFKANLRELFHFIKLRSGKMGHKSYRKIAQDMYKLIKEKQPLMAKYISCEMGD